MEPISDKQKVMYDFIVHYMKSEGMPPTYREIGLVLGMTSTGHIDHHLSVLEKRGWITRLQGKGRGIKLTARSRGIPIRGAIAAGAPLDIYPDPPRFLQIDDLFAPTDHLYALVVRGHSMIDECICDKDYVVINSEAVCESGDIVVAVHLQAGVAGSATLKRWFQEGNGVRLQPANSEVEPIRISKTAWCREWELQGKVIAILRPCTLSAEAFF